MDITPLHEVQDNDKLGALVADMATNGWTGRPVLVVDEFDDGTYMGITGSHRIAATQRLAIDPEIYEVHTDGLDLVALFEARDDEDRLAVLKEGNDQEAIQLMEQEVEANK